MLYKIDICPEMEELREETYSRRRMDSLEIDQQNSGNNRLLTSTSGHFVLYDPL